MIRLKTIKKEKGLTCRDCRYFLDDPLGFEKAFPGILILSSGQGDTRGSQGICCVHKKMADSKMSCNDFSVK